MTPDQTAHVRAHVAAVSKLLLGNKTMNPGLMIVAGEPINPVSQLEIGSAMVEAKVDLIYLEFTIGEGNVPVMTGIDVMLPHHSVCYVSTGCRLSLLPGKARAVILPQDCTDFHYKVLSDEIVQMRGRPASLASGCDRAAAKLSALVRGGVDVEGQVALRTW